MKKLQTILTILALSMAGALVACGGGSSNSGGGGGGTNPISVSVSGATSPLTVNATASITATVSNDSANGGVTWSCTPSSTCGSFNPTSTASAVATTYTAPSAPAAVTVTATSVTDPTKSASASITVSAAPIALTDGNYVFAVDGSSITGQAYVLTGVFTVAGGVITGGEQDYVDTTPIADTHDAINATGSTFTTTTDGNLQLTLTTCLGVDCTQVDPVINSGTGGIPGVETLNGTVISTSTCGTAGGPCSARLIEFDATNTSSGSLELQSSVAAPAGSYAFGLRGAPAVSTAVGGIFSVSGTTISPTTTVLDLNQGGTVSTDQSITSGSVTAPDATGRLQVSMIPTSGTPPNLAFAAYIVDTNHIRIMGASAPLIGTAYLQNTASLAVAGNSYVVSTTGVDSVNYFQLAGLLTLAQGSTAVTGTISYNDDLNAIQPAGTLTGGTYVADTTFPGRVTITGLTDGVTANNPDTFNLELYVDGNGNAVAISLDVADVIGGTAYEQGGVGSFTAGALSGTYALNVSGYDGVNELEYDAVGPIAADGVGALNTTTVDLNWLNAALDPGATVTGTFTAASTGIFPGTLVGLDVSGGTTDTYTYYLIDTTRAVAIEVDGTQWGLGSLDLQQ